LSVEGVNSDGREALYREAAEVLEGVVKRLREEPRRERHVGLREAGKKRKRRVFDFGMIDLSPVSGAANPVAPPMKVEHEDENRAVGIVRFPESVGTGAGTVHHGYLAASLDEVFGAALGRMGHPVMTGILDVRFLDACCVEEEVRIEGRVRRVSGDVVFTRGRVREGGRLVAEGDAAFFIVGEDQYKRFADARNRKLKVG
jgi:acyl-coenzyme A thioesterase PaaI-like protein